MRRFKPLQAQPVSRLAALDAVTECLHGRCPEAPDWMAILELANRSLVTPQLESALRSGGAGDRLPEDLRVFLADVRRRNRERNRRLMDQLGAALVALNQAGIEPVLLKGAALWATMGFETPFDRILADVDVLVRPSSAAGAISALESADFRAATRYPGAQVHVVAELAREGDPGFLDLHQRPPGPPGFAEIPGLERHCRRIDWQGGTALVPPPAIQIFFLILHDQFHDGDYWHGAFDLRHLADIAALSHSDVEWDLLDSLCQTALLRTATDVELIAAARVAGAEVPQRYCARTWPQLVYRRHLWQFAHPRWASTAALLALAAEWRTVAKHRRETREADHRVVGDELKPLSPALRIARIRRMLLPGANKA
jgi:hypothetical protein